MSYEIKIRRYDGDAPAVSISGAVPEGEWVITGPEPLHVTYRELPAAEIRRVQETG